MPKIYRQVTLLFLIKNGSILLAMKKRGFGQGRWNGVGGKLNPGETIEAATIRETQEEINVTPKSLEKVAVINFYFKPDTPKESFNQQAHVYFCKQWDGEPSETEEMNPKWYDLDQIPYSQMWPDDIYWLPEVIGGKKINAEFHFDNDDNVIKYEIVEAVKK